MILKNGKRIDGCSDTVPIGSLNPYLGTTAPFGYLICEGQLVSKTTYPELYAICGDTFGQSTADEFYLPDLRERVIAGYKQGDSTFGTLGGLIGEKTHTLTKSEVPKLDGEIRVNQWTTNGATYTSGDFTGLASEYVYNMAVYSDNIGRDRFTTVHSTYGGGQAHNNIQPTICLNWIVKAIMLIPNQSTVVNVRSNSPTNVYGCEYINNLPSGGSLDEQYINSSLWWNEFYTSAWDDYHQVTNTDIVADMKNVMTNITLDSIIRFGQKTDTLKNSEELLSTYLSISDTEKDINFAVNLEEGYAFVSATYNIPNDTIEIYLTKHKAIGSDPRTKTTLNLEADILPGNSYVTSTDVTNIVDLCTQLTSNPVDIIYITDGLNKHYEAHYKITQSATDKIFTISFTTDLGDCEIQYRDYGYNTDCYVYFREDYMERELYRMYNNMPEILYIDSYERSWGGSTYWGGTTADDDIYNPGQHDVNDGFQWNSSNHRFETKALSSSSTEVSSELQVNNPKWNYSDTMNISFNVTGSSSIPAMELKLYVNNVLMGTRAAQPNDSGGISLYNVVLQNNDLIKVVATPVNSTLANTKAYISFETYNSEQTVASTGTEEGFKSNLKEFASAITNTNSSINKNKYLVKVKVPDLLHQPNNYNVILGETFLTDYRYTENTSSSNTIYEFNVNTLPFEYDYSPTILHLEFSYDPNDYNDPITINNIYISILGISPDEFYFRYAGLETVLDELYGPTLSWSGYNNYLQYDGSFTSLKITNTSSWETIKLTISSSSLSDPIVTTLVRGGTLTLDDIGITYDSIKAEWDDSSTTTDVWRISSALHAKLNYTGVTINGNLNITGSYQINNDPVIWDDGV